LSPNQRVVWNSISEESPERTALSARSAQFLAASGPYQAVVSMRPSAAVRLGKIAAKASATMPPMEAPATVAEGQPTWLMSSSRSSANSSTV
jgi:hypothetical protein